MISKEKTKYYIVMLIISLLIYKSINTPEFLIGKLEFLGSLLNPIVWAFSIAYLLNPIMVYLERKFKCKRILSILIIYLLLLSATSFTITIISPRIVSSLDTIGYDLPNYIKTSEQWINDNIVNSKLLQYSFPFLKSNLNDVLNKSMTFLNLTSAHIVSKAIHFTTNFISAILGLFISIYMLSEKESFIRGTRRFLYAFLNKSKADYVINLGKLSHKIFSEFIIGKFIDSLIIGFICFVGGLLLGIKYNMLISIIIGITNIIPYFGPFIGLLIAIVITLFSGGLVKTIWFLIFFFFLKQFDDLYLAPKILGEKTGLSPFWVIVAVIIGGEGFGLAGMVLGVPIIAIIKIELEKSITKRLHAKNL